MKQIFCNLDISLKLEINNMNIKYKKLIPQFIFVLAIFSYLIYANWKTRQFYVKEVNSKIMDRNNWQSRSTVFTLENGLIISKNYAYPLDLKVGDSISKKANTGKFKLFRKNDTSNYKLYKIYDIGKFLK